MELKDHPVFSLLKPKEYLDSVEDVDFRALRSKGIKAIIADLDDTLLPRREFRVSLSVFSWVQKAKDEGFNVYICTNGSRIPRLNYVTDNLNIEGAALAFKPLPFGFLKAAKKMGVKVKETAVIGDQMITDIVGGNMLGMHTILVKPVSEETSIIRIPFRRFENLLIRFLALRTGS